MKALTDERWQEIRYLTTGGAMDTPIGLKFALAQTLEQHDHLAAQIKLLADYIMSERPDDPALKLGEGACAMAVEIMKREGDVEIAYKGLQEHKDFLVKKNRELERKIVKMGEEYLTFVRAANKYQDNMSKKLDHMLETMNNVNP